MGPEQQTNPNEPATPPAASPANPTPETTPVETPTFTQTEPVNPPVIPAENEPQPQPTSEPTSGLVVTPKKSKKKLIALLSIVGAVLVVLGGSWAAYALWYNNPDNAVQDAFSKALSAKSMTTTGTIKSTSDGTTIKIDMSTATNEAKQSSADLTLGVTASGQTYTVKGHFASTSDAVFVKLDDVRSLLTASFSADEKAMFDTYYGSLLDKIDSKWVIIKQSDLESLSDGSVTTKETQCFQTEIAKIETDASVRNELSDLYKKHPLFTIESKGSDSDGNHYNLVPVTNAKAKEFAIAAVETKFFKTLDDCTSDDLKKSFTDSFNEASDQESKTTGSIEVWVDGWTHTLKKVTVTSKDDTTDVVIEVKPVFNTNPSVTIPAGQTTVDDLKSEIQNILSGFLTSTSESTLPTSTL